MMATTSFAQRTEDIVFGFMKEAQNMLPYKEKSYFTIPPSIGYIVLSYYRGIEYFSAHGPKMTLNEDRDTCKYVGNGDANTVYGEFSINDKSEYDKLIWNFAINIPDRQTIAAIGIDSTDKKYVDSTFVGVDNVMFAWQCSIYTAHTNGTIYRSDGGYLDGENYGESSFVRPDTKVLMELDIRNKTLKYCLNDKDQGIALYDLDFQDREYHLAITVDEKADIQLLDFCVL